MTFPLSPSPGVRRATDEALQKAVEYFRDRGGALFLSGQPFFEAHAFVQQSLPRVLAKAGVPVTWLETPSRRFQRPHVDWTAPSFKIDRLISFPFSRFARIKEASTKMQLSKIKAEIARLGGNPVVWIQAALDPDLAKRLPYVDVFSLFDHPYSVEPQGALCRAASLITTQNSFTFELMAEAHPQKTRVMIPPIHLTPDVFNVDEPPVALPAHFPETIVGYVGSSHYDRFDFALWHGLVREMPDIGFLLAGRTDARGEACIEQMRDLRNFHYIPELEKHRVPGVLKRLDVSFLAYQETLSQLGSYPTKIVESTKLGIPTVGVECVQCRDIGAFFPLAKNKEDAKKLILSSLNTKRERLQQIYDELLRIGSPEIQLAFVADWLTRARETKRSA